MDIKLKWICEETRIIREIGVLKEGDEFDCHPRLAKQLISQKLAKEIKKKEYGRRGKGKEEDEGN